MFFRFPLGKRAKSKMKLSTIFGTFISSSNNVLFSIIIHVTNYLFYESYLLWKQYWRKPIWVIKIFISYSFMSVYITQYCSICDLWNLWVFFILFFYMLYFYTYLYYDSTDDYNARYFIYLFLEKVLYNYNFYFIEHY